MKFLIAGVLVIHGLITASQSSKSFGLTIPPGLKNPSWLNWWPTNLGRSWILSRLGLEKIPFIWLCGLLWLVGGVILITAGLGSMGIIIPISWWRTLTLIGALISFFMLLVYLHPLFALGIGLNVIILLALFLSR